MQRIPSLDAEEALLAATVAALPHLKPTAQKQIVRAWKKLANAGSKRVFTRLEDFKAWLAGHGV